MAADYYPTSAQPDFSNPLMTYSRNYAFGTFHPGAAQLSPQLPPPFLLHSAPMPPFQSPFMYIRPAFVDGLPINAMHPFQPSPPDHISAELPRNNFLTNNKQPQLQRTRPRSAQFSPHQSQQPTSEIRDVNSAAKARKKKKKSKSDASNDLSNALAEVSLEEDSMKIATSSLPCSGPSQSYSDVLKRPPPAQPVSEGEEKVENVKQKDEPTNSTLLNPIVEEFPSLDTSKQQRAQSAKLSSSSFPQQQLRGVLHVPSGTLDSSNNRSGRQSNSFKLNLASLTPDVPNQPKKQKSSSSSRQDRPQSPEQSPVKQAGGTKSATPKKSSPTVPETSPSTTTDSPERKPKYSKLKKVILEERKKRQQHVVDAEENELHNARPDTGSNSPEHDIEPTATEDNSAKVAEGASPVQSSVNKSSLLKSTVNSLGNVCNAYLSSALSGLSKEDADAICRRLHRRRFREYCNQVLGAALDDAAYLLLTTLGGFQQRQYEQNPVKAKLRRRYVCGLREAVKHIQLGKAKCIVLAPNIERIPGKGGLDDMIGLIISQCAIKNVPVVFALGRVALGRACSKPSPVSSVAIISPAGAEEKFKQTLELAQRAHESYIELVKMAVAEQLEQREQSSKHSTQPEKIYSAQTTGAHVQFPPCHQLGHSRNASNISAISFISNVSAVSDQSGGLNNVPSTESAEDDDKTNHLVPSESDESDRDEEEDVGDIVEDGGDFQEDDNRESIVNQSNNDTA